MRIFTDDDDMRLRLLNQSRSELANAFLHIHRCARKTISDEVRNQLFDVSSTVGDALNLLEDWLESQGLE